MPLVYKRSTHVNCCTTTRDHSLDIRMLAGPNTNPDTFRNTVDELNYKALMAKMELLVEEDRLTENEYVDLSNVLKFHRDHCRSIRQLEKAESDRQTSEAMEVQGLLLHLAHPAAATRERVPPFEEPGLASSTIPSWVRDTMSITFGP